MNRSLWFSIVLTILAFAGSLFVYYGLFDQLPAQVPTHWNGKGIADAWTPKGKLLPYLLLVPGIMAFFVGLTVILPWLSPQPFSVNAFRGTFNYIMALVVALIAYLHVAITCSYLQPDLNTLKWMLGGMSLFFAAIGNSLGKVKRNFWMGVRTPWTLASERVWNQTHRVTAWLWTGGGLLGCLAALAGVNVIAWLIGLFVIVITPVLYSLWLYKHLEKRGLLSDVLESPAS